MSLPSTWMKTLGKGKGFREKMPLCSRGWSSRKRPCFGGGAVVVKSVAWLSHSSPVPVLQAGLPDLLSLGPEFSGRREAGRACRSWALTHSSPFPLSPPAQWVSPCGLQSILMVKREWPAKDQLLQVFILIVLQGDLGRVPRLVHLGHQSKEE